MAMRGLPLVRPKCNLLSIIRPSSTPICRASPPSLRILRQLQQTPRQPQSRLFSHTALRSYNQFPDPFGRRQQHQKPPPPTHVDYDPALGDPWYHHRLRSAKPLFSSSPGQIIRSPRTHTVVVVSIALALAFYFYNLETVPVSGRKRFNCYSEATLHELGVRQAKHVVYDLERQGGGFLPSWDPRTRMVQRVMDRLIPVSGMEADDNSSGKLNPNTHRDEWEVHVIDDGDLRRANAFVLPGGKVFVYSGLLRLTRSDAQLAAVLSHEIAHNLAKHHAERLSQSVGETFFLGSALMLLAATPFTFVFGYMFGGSLLDLLFSRPMNRMQESEADYIGLMMMAEACYDPREAITFWQRLETVQSQLGMEPPEFMSTHPSNQHRIERITKWLPEAVEKRQSSDCVGTQGFAEMFRRAMASGHVISGGM